MEHPLPRVVAVHAGAMRTLTLRGEQVPTGIFKSAVHGPVGVGTDGLEGDARAERLAGDDSRAVSVMAVEHLRHWGEVLGGAPPAAGFLGENLTTEGVLETDVQVGETWRVGTAVLQATQPRIPCRKLDARMGIPFQGRFLRSRRTGFYLRVLRPGVLRAGDVIHREPPASTAPTMDAWLCNAVDTYWDAEALDALLASPALGPRAREDLADRRARAATAEGYAGGRDLRVVEREQEDADTVSLWLECARGKPLPRFRGGQSVMVSWRRGEQDRAIRRAYAVSSSPAEPRWRITARAVAEPGSTDGVLSRHLASDAAVGTVLRATAPRGSFSLPGPGRTPLWLVGAGTGLAPITAMVHDWVLQGRQHPLRVLAWGPGTPRGLLQEVRALVDVEACTTDDLHAHVRGIPPDATAMVAGATGNVDLFSALWLASGRDPASLATLRFGQLPALEAGMLNALAP